jgi:predicted DNA-binding transcriptional regulator YafY
LTEAVVSNRVVEFDYFSLRASKPELRRVAPYHLACINNQWYLIGADQTRDQLRTFALTRVANVKNLKIPFTRPTNFSVAKMLAGSFAAFQAERTEHVKIRFDAFAARLVRERQWHKSQKMRPTDDGGMELTMRVGIAPDLENWILSWGDHAEVMEPLELRKRIRTTIRNMATKYQVSPS